MKELESILSEFTSDPHSPAVVATLVQAAGSSYRRVGARLLWRPNGTKVGSISGGCLEEDVLMRVSEVFQTGKSQWVIYDTTSENDLVWGVGLGCHGIVYLALERVTGFPIQYAHLEAAWKERRDTVLGTIFPIKNGSPLLPAAACLVDHHEMRWGSGVIEDAAARTEADRCLASQENHYSERMVGGERAGVLWEYLPPPFYLNIFGAGDDALPLCRLARELGWRVRVYDPRPAFATKARFPAADEVILYQGEAPDVSSIDRWSAAVIMTHHYRFDVPLLRKVLTTPTPYIGLLGPRKRAEKIWADLHDPSGATTTFDQRLHAPVGLDLGASSPEQVALSILAEIEASFNRRDGRPLRERTRPIHG